MRVVRLAKCLGVGFPNALNISLKLLLPSTYPGRIVLFCNLDALVAEQDRYPLQWNSLQQQVHCKRVPKPVRVSSVNAS